MRFGLALVLALMAAPAVGQSVEVRGPVPQGHDRTRPAWPVVARLSGPTDRYDHDVLGGIPPWSVLEVRALPCGVCREGFTDASAVLPAMLVFEDVAPRLWDVTGDGRPEVVVVESHVQRGARLAVWGFSDTGAELTRLAATNFIGTRHRWLAPVGAGDFDGDGRIEMAYVDRPHLTRELVFVRLDGGELREIRRLAGFSAHRIGDTTITSAVRICADGSAEVLVPDADWGRLLGVGGGALVKRDEGPMTDTAPAEAAKRPCR